LGEELGWRGFALPRLQTRFHPVVASVLLGLLWANWHLPLLIVSFYTMPYWFYVPFVTSASVIIGFGFNLSGGSACAIYLHGLLNVGLGIIMNDFLGKATVRPISTQNVMMTVCFLIAAVLLAMLTKGRLGAKPAESRGVVLVPSA
jgi:membrane protease YdiL (CAAX protease family)